MMLTDSLQSVFDRPGRAFAPSLLTHKTQKKSSHLESSSVTIPKLAKYVAAVGI